MQHVETTTEIKLDGSIQNGYHEFT